MLKFLLRIIRNKVMRLVLFCSKLRPLTGHVTQKPWVSKQWLSTVVTSNGGGGGGGGEGGGGGVREQSLPSRVRSTPFDTHCVFKQLEKGGFTPQQAEGLVGVLLGVLRANDKQMAEFQVAHRDLDLLELKLKGEVDSIRSDHILLEKATVAQLRGEQEMLKAQIHKLKDVMKEEMVKVQAGVQLDINLEKSRSREETTVMKQAVKDTNSRIGTEVALLRTLIESQKLELVKYLAGGIISLVTIMVSVVLGLWRLIK